MPFNIEDIVDVGRQRSFRHTDRVDDSIPLRPTISADPFITVDRHAVGYETVDLSDNPADLSEFQDDDYPHLELN